ncbi:MAG: ATP-binding protein [Proteobacteria bacterium]|nr:ATP-binding protein [Pseudomonadota bacterium]
MSPRGVWGSVVPVYNPRMGRRRLLDRLARVLQLAERWLEEQTGAAPDSAAFAQFTAFRFDARLGPGRLVPIPDPAPFELSGLVGVERPLARLVENTEQFLAALPSNHVLLYGERGTGKSSAVRGLLTRYAARGLRMVEVSKADLVQLPRVLAGLRGMPYRFLVYCDDLSFDQGEPGYRELKAALEGSLEGPPENVRIVATSNRRHLLPETQSDNRAAHLDDQGDLHLGEVLDEKLALSERFGLMLGFYGFDQTTYLSIVEHHLKRAGVADSLDDVREAALRFALRRSSRSGRVARQFVDDWVGRHRLHGDGGGRGL